MLSYRSEAERRLRLSSREEKHLRELLKKRESTIAELKKSQNQTGKNTILSSSSVITSPDITSNHNKEIILSEISTSKSKSNIDNVDTVGKLNSMMMIQTDSLNDLKRELSAAKAKVIVTLRYIEFDCYQKAFS